MTILASHDKCASGAAGLIVSGMVDPVRGIDTDLLPNVALTAIRLRAEPEETSPRRYDVDSPYAGVLTGR